MFKNSQLELNPSFRIAIKCNPELFDARANYGVLLLRLERFDEARQQLEEAVTLNPNDPKLYNVLGIIYKRQVTQAAK